VDVGFIFFVGAGGTPALR